MQEKTLKIQLPQGTLYFLHVLLVRSTHRDVIQGAKLQQKVQNKIPSMHLKRGER